MTDSPIADTSARPPQPSVLASLAGILLACVAFVVAWFVGSFLFTLLDSLRGLGDSKIQEVFRTLLVPGFGGYLGLASVGRWLPRAGIWGVFFGFSALIFMVVGMYITFLLSPTRRAELTIWEGALPLLVLTSAIVGAYLYAKEHR